MSIWHHPHFFHLFKNKFVFGTNGDDALDGTRWNDIMFGFGGYDEIHGLQGNDTLFGGRGNDLVDGGDGNDDLFGGKGNDAIVGGKGADDLHGDDGNDFLVSGKGNDDLEGGRGSDTFVIRTGTGKDTIEDLHLNDRIDLRDFNFASVADLFGASGFKQTGYDAVLNLGNGDRLVIEDWRIADLSAHPELFIISNTRTGPSSSQSPYVVPVADDISIVSLLTVGDQVGLKDDGVTPWKMVGIPDGLGAFDNGDGTFTVLMNHELGPTSGVVRDHGATGAFVSRLVIDKTTLEVEQGSDLIQNVFLYDTATDSFFDAAASGTPYAFNRLCSADLPELSAFYNPLSGLGYNGRIFTNGEETGPPFSPDYGKAFAHVVTGAEEGNSYEVAWLGDMSFENVIANPYSGDKTVVAVTDDATPGQVYFYFGDKKAAGNAVEKAGLTGGSLWGLQVSEWNNGVDNNNESSGTDLGGDFTSAIDLVNLGDVSDLDGFALQANSEASSVTEFLRPEDGQWDTIDEDRFYFVTTNNFNAPSRLWAVDFNDASDPNAGGTITMLLDGTEGQQMLDNMTVTKDGKVLLQEDPGSNNYNARIWEYDPLADSLTELAKHDPSRFETGGASFLTINEESSGIIDVTDILGSAGQNAFLFDVQAHYAIGGELVEGGQLGVMYQDLV